MPDHFIDDDYTSVCYCFVVAFLYYNQVIHLLLHNSWNSLLVNILLSPIIVCWHVLYLFYRLHWSRKRCSTCMVAGRQFLPHWNTRQGESESFGAFWWTQEAVQTRCCHCFLSIWRRYCIPHDQPLLPAEKWDSHKETRQVDQPKKFFFP